MTATRTLPLSLLVLVGLAWLVMPRQTLEVASAPVGIGNVTDAEGYRDMNVMAQPHAANRHGADEVSDVRRCLQDRGPYMVIGKRLEPRFWLVCRMPDGRVGGQLVKWDVVLSRWVEITAFIPKGGVAAAAERYLRSVGVVLWEAR